MITYNQNKAQNILFCSHFSTPSNDTLADISLRARAGIAIAVRLSVTIRYRFKPRWDRDFRISPYVLESLVFRDKISCLPLGEGGLYERGENSKGRSWRSADQHRPTVTNPMLVVKEEGYVGEVGDLTFVDPVRIWRAV